MDQEAFKELENKITKELEDKYWDSFITQSYYLGNGIYVANNNSIASTDTRELFLMFIGQQEFDMEFD